MAFFDQPISDIVPRIHAGTLKAETVVARSLDRIAAGDGTVHAFISVQPEVALARARELDALPMSERQQMPLCGIPVAIKDNICTKDLATTCASRMLATFVPPYNATVVDALVAAGAIVVGKTNLDEFAMGSSTESSFYGITRNPHNPAHIPGGSSGGSAAAVAADFVPLSLGSDTGGSIRQPASHCGVIGLKPTYGRVSRYGLVAFASSLDQIGPMAHYTQDIALALQIIARPDKHDSTCAGRPFATGADLFSRRIDGMKIGLPREYFGSGLSDDVRQLMALQQNRLMQAGAQIVDVSLPTLRHAIATYYIICTAEASSNLARYDGVKYGFRTPEECATLVEMYKRTRSAGFGAEVKRRIMLGTYVLSSGYYDAYYLKAARLRTLITRDFAAAFTQCNAIMSPVAPTPAPRIGATVNDPLQMYLTDIYTVSANLAGIPAISVPCGNNNDLPVGIQFMAPHWHEQVLVKLSHIVKTPA